MKAKWLTSCSELPTATIASLCASLLTPDGRGPKFKESCLVELLKRQQKSPGILLVEEVQP